MFALPPIAGSAPGPGPQARPEAFICWTLRLALAVLAVWSACLWVIAGRAFGCCWAGMVEAAATELAAVAFALALPNYVVRAVFRLTMRIRPGDALGAQMLLAGGGRTSSVRRARRLLWLLAIALALSAGGGLLSTAGTHLATPALQWLAGKFLYPAWWWSCARLGVQVVLFLPLAAGTAAVALAGSLLRRYGPSDPYRHLTRDVMWSSSAGLAAAAGLWWVGADLEGVGFVCAAALAGLSVTVALRRDFAAKAVRLAGPVAAPRHRKIQRWYNLGAFAVLTWVVTLQCRALRDAASWDWAATWMWVAATAGIAAVVTRRLNRRVRPAGAVEARAAMAAAVVVAGMQVALLGLAGAGWRPRWAWIGLAWALQVPFAALAAGVLARRRRLFARTGCPGRFWLADAALGAAAGAAGATFTLALDEGLRVTAVVALGCLMVMFLSGAVAAGEGSTRARRPGGLRRQFAWAAIGAAMILAVVMIWAGLVNAVARGPRRQLVVGASLTAYQAGGHAVAALPVQKAHTPSAALTDLARELIRSREGRWWVITAGDAELLKGLGEGVRASLYFPDEAVGRLPLWRDEGPPRAFGRYLNVHVQGLDGVYISGLSVDHPDAWCLYNGEAFVACRKRIAPGGLMVVRVAGSLPRLAEVLRVVKTFDWAVAEGAAAVAVDRERVEILLAARRGGQGQSAVAAVLQARAGAGVKVTSVKDLVAIEPDLDRLRIRTPGGRTGAEVDRSALAYWLGVRGK